MFIVSILQISKFLLCALIATGSGASSGSDNDIISLQAGLCARQQQVSSTDAYIAKEALELLVTCLQLRSSLLCTYYRHIIVTCLGIFNFVLGFSSL